MPNEWQTVLDEIKNNVSEMAYKAYFVRFFFVSNEDGILTTSVPNVFIKTQIEGKYHNTVLDALKVAGMNPKDLKVIIDGSENKTTAKRAVEILDDDNKFFAEGEYAKYCGVDNTIYVRYVRKWTKIYEISPNMIVLKDIRGVLYDS